MPRQKIFLSSRFSTLEPKRRSLSDLGRQVCSNTTPTVRLTRTVRPVTRSCMELNLFTVLMFFVAAFGFVFLTLTVGRIFRPDNPSDDKNSTYECGERPIGEAWMQFNPRFYLVALIFIIFDVEMAFVFPIATVFKDFIVEGHGVLAFVELVIFMAILLLGLIYVWLKGDLQWVKTLGKRFSA